MRNRYRTALLPTLLTSLLWAVAAAQDDSTIPLPEYHRQALLNGMEILFLPGKEAKAQFLLMVINGAAFDPVEKWGVTYLTTKMMIESGVDRTGQPALSVLKNLGAELNYEVSWDGVYFEGLAPSERVVEALGVLAQIVVQPRFEEEAFQKVRAQVLEEVEQRQAKIECASQDYLMQELFSVNPYGHPVRGTAATLRNLQLSDVKIQYRKLFLPNQARLAFYHGGDENLAFSALSRRWGSWVRAIEAPFTFRRAEGPREPSVLLLDRPDAKEGLFRWGALGVTRSAREFIALKVLEQYLTLSFPAWADQVASSGQIRASAVVAARRMPGHFQVNVQAPPEYLPGYLRRTLETLSQLQTGQIEQQRFEEAKHLAANEMKQALEDPASRLRELLDTSLFNVGVTYISNYGLRVGRLTPETFQSALKEVFSNRPSLTVIAGPAERLQPELTELGKVRVLH